MERERVVSLLTILLVPPPPDDENFLQLLFALLTMITQPPPDPLLNIRQRLFGSVENHWIGRDVFQSFSQHRYEFFQITGETPETMIDILSHVAPRMNQDDHIRLLPRNRVMLFLVWLRSYPCFSLLSLLFEVSTSTVANEIDRMRSVMWDTFADIISWPSVQESRGMRGNWSELADAVAAMDGTSHAIYRPGVEPQQLYYSGHRHYHCIHTMIIVDNTGVLRFVRSGFLGHQNDALILNLLPSIGPNEKLNLPPDCMILADKIFPNRPPILTPYKQQQLLEKPREFRRKCRQFNKILNCYRVSAEHAIRDIKIYRVIGTLWRMPRWKISAVVEICAALAVRRRRLFQH